MHKDMKVVGTWTCRRCGAVITSEIDHLDPFRMNPMPKGWEYVGVNLFCDECMVLYNRMLERFVKRMVP